MKRGKKLKHFHDSVNLTSNGNLLYNKILTDEKQVSD